MIKSVASVKVKGRRVLLRAGFDVPLEADGSGGFKVVDDARIKAGLPTITKLLKEKAKVIIINHSGRPEGKWNKDFSQLPVAQRLADLLNLRLIKIKDEFPTYKQSKNLYFYTEDFTTANVVKLSKALPEGEILFLENLRFYPGEEKNDSKFVSVLAKLGDVYVDDAFSVAHREAASNVGIAGKLPAYAGLTLLEEINSLNKAKKPVSPLVVIMGGAKISDKIDTIHFLAKKAEKVLIGGAIANSFLSAKGYEIGTSKASDISLAKELLREYRDKIILPIDVVVAKSPDDSRRSITPDKVRANESIFDIGPETIRKFAQIVKTAKTLIWNGPMGLIEKKEFSFGSMAVAQMFAAQTKGKAYGVVGGGESLEVVDRAHVAEFIDHVSTGGGAMLEYLSGKTLPAIKALDK